MAAALDLRASASPDQAAKRIRQAVAGEGSIVVTAKGPRGKRLVRRIPERLPQDWTVHTNTIAAGDEPGEDTVYTLYVRRPDADERPIAFFTDARKPTV